MKLNDATAFVVDEAGNVGIGTTNPGYELEVVGDARLLAGNDYYIGDIGLNDTGSSAITSGGYLVGLYADEYYNSASTNVQDVIDDLDNAIGTRTYTGGGTYISDDQTLTLSINALDTALLGVSGDTTPQGSIDGQTIRYQDGGWITDLNLFNDGTNIGIGTTDPQYKLDVVGDIAGAAIRATSDLYVGAIGIGDTGSSVTTSGAYLVGVYDDNYYNITSSSDLQAALGDLDSAIGARTYSEQNYVS